MYKVGDKVKVREWDDMASEHEVDVDGDIVMIPEFFTRRMKKYCGMVVTIKEVDFQKQCYKIAEDDSNFKWSFVDEMFEHTVSTLDHPFEPVGKTDNIDHPSHYNREGAMECIDEMILIFGKEAVRNFCLLNAWKYRYRASDKGHEEDIKKSDWYIKRYSEIKE